MARGPSAPSQPIASQGRGSGKRKRHCKFIKLTTAPLPRLPVRLPSPSFDPPWLGPTAPVEGSQGDSIGSFVPSGGSFLRKPPGQLAQHEASRRAERNSADGQPTVSTRLCHSKEGGRPQSLMYSASCRSNFQRWWSILIRELCRLQARQQLLSLLSHAPSQHPSCSRVAASPLQT